MRGKIDFAKLQRVLGKYKFVALILCLGGGADAAAHRRRKAKAQTAVQSPNRRRADQTFDLEDLERRMESALSEINGVGGGHRGAHPPLQRGGGAGPGYL